jgi:cytochrome b involved in lipid metabolism
MRKYILIIALSLVLSGCGAEKTEKISIPPINQDNKNMENTNQVNSAAGYTLEEVTKHFSKEDCWLASNGKVYDVTSFTDKHPGGEAILQGCGKDMSEFFNTKHAKQSKEQLPAFYIGDLK